jgi:sulfur-oxidizing protein SoxY
MTDESESYITRRAVLAGVAGVTAFGTIPLVVRRAEATPETMKAAIHRVIGESPVSKGKVTLDIPPLVENGNTIAMSVSVDSPMTETNYVKAIHVFNEKNPQPDIVSVHLGPRAGKAAFSTRIRLADSQNVVAIAELSDGSLWSDSVEVIVTIAACLEYN